MVLQVVFLRVALLQVLPRGGPSSLIVAGYPWACGFSMKFVYLEWGLDQELGWELDRELASGSLGGEPFSRIDSRCSEITF